MERLVDAEVTGQGGRHDGGGSERNEPVWERPWSLEEIRNSSDSWSLAADAGLLNFLQEFSQQTISKTHEIEKQLDGLIRDTKTTNCRLHNVFNDFLMLSNTQFIENRVYDEDIAEAIPKSDTGDKPEQEKTREQKEAELIPKVQEAVNFGLQVLESAFEQLDIKAGNSDSEEEEINERVEPILEPKDLYIDRPLPYIIGSKLFMEQEDVGLGDFSSEEGSIDSDRASGVDSEDEQDERESDDNSENRYEEQRLQAVLSDEEDDDGSNLFDSEKEDEEDIIEDHAKSEKRPRPTSFADELAARIKGDAADKPNEEPECLSSVETITKKQMKEKKETRTVPSDDEDDEDDMFKPPKLTDEDFSPFGTQGGLFSGGRGLFDDDEDDLFVDVPRAKKEKEIKIKTPVSDEPSPSNQAKKVPVGGVSLFPGADQMFNPSSVLAEKDKSKSATPKPETAPKLPTPSSGLFDDDDFFGNPSTKPTNAGKTEGDAEPFNEKQAVPPLTQSNANTQSQRVKEKTTKKMPSPEEPKSLPPPSLKTQAKGLFSDEEDAEDLFSPSTNVTKPKVSFLPPSKTSKAISLFEDEEEDSLFNIAPVKTQITVKKPQDQIKGEERIKIAGSTMFSSDEEDSWNRTKTIKPISEQMQKDNITKPTQPKDHIEKTEKKTSLFDDWNSAKTTKPAPKQMQKDNVTKPSQPKDQTEKVEKKTSLFDDKEEDLFATTKADSTKKSHRASLLFEEDSNEGTLFPAVPVSSPPVLQILEKVKSETLPSSLDKETKEDVLVLKTEKKSPEEKVEVENKPNEKSGVFDEADAKVEPKKEVQMPISALPDDEDDDDLFPRLPPPDVEDKKVKKNVLSLFDEDDDNDNFEDQLMNRNLKKEIKMPSDVHPHSKSTGVFQDEELLFSHKLQKDNDPDVDLFANAKKQVSEKPASARLSSGAVLFGDEDEDDLFSTTKPKPPPMSPEKEMFSKKDSTHVAKEISQLPKRPDIRVTLSERGRSQENLEQKPTDPGTIKAKDQDSRIGKLQTNLTINPATLLPGATFKPPGAKSNSSAVDVVSQYHGGEASDTRSSTKSKKEGVGVSFDHPVNVSTLHSANKDRIKVAGKRRPPSRAGRRLASQDSSETEEVTVPALHHLPFVEDAPVILEAKWSQTEEPKASTYRTERAVNGIIVQPSSSTNDISSEKTTRISERLPPSGFPDFFGSDDLAAKSAKSKITAGAKSKEKSNEGMAKKHRKAEKKSSLPVLDDQGSDDDLFQSTKPKSTKPSREPSLFSKDGEADLFGDQKITKKKEAKATSGRDLKQHVPNIFEDDIFASEAIPSVKKIKEKDKTVDIFDDNMDIFADLTVKPKEKKKKVEPRSIFDDDMDDIFASGNKVKTSKTKSQIDKSTSEPKSERKGSFDDPLNAFGGP